jgi:hypothetical protein
MSRKSGLPRACAGSFNAGTGIYKMGNVFKMLLPKTAAARLAAGTKVGGASARDYLLRFSAPLVNERSRNGQYQE